MRRLGIVANYRCHSLGLIRNSMLCKLDRPGRKNHLGFETYQRFLFRRLNKTIIWKWGIGLLELMDVNIQWPWYLAHGVKQLKTPRDLFFFLFQRWSWNSNHHVRTLHMFSYIRPATRIQSIYTLQKIAVTFTVLFCWQPSCNFFTIDLTVENRNTTKDHISTITVIFLLLPKLSPYTH
jgi:hypothetical protein